jgi:hypothetical protein
MGSIAQPSRRWNYEPRDPLPAGNVRKDIWSLLFGESVASRFEARPRG